MDSILPSASTQPSVLENLPGGLSEGQGLGMKQAEFLSLTGSFFLILNPLKLWSPVYTNYIE